MRRPGTLLLTIFLARTALVTAQNGEAWMNKGQKELNDALKMKLNTNVAKNVIFFLGDGMGVSTVTAGRIYKGQMEGQPGEETILSFEKFSNVALSKTYNTDRQTSDSAGTATAFLCGVKANVGTVGLDETVLRYDCPNQENGKVTSILKWSLDEGKSAGLVSTARVTHATPAAGYAHSADRNWEGDLDIAAKNFTGQCKDIAVQLMENLDLKVIMGGGRRYFLLNNETDPETGGTNKHRADGRDLIKEWQMSKTSQGKTSEYVSKKSEFDAVDPAKTDYLLGLFEASHMQYEIDRDSSPNGEPSLAEMTEKAINILKKQTKGYFLLVEAGRIDHAHHDNLAKKALHDLAALDEAVTKAASITDEADTLIVVSADHSHVFSMGGYAAKGKDILGLADYLGTLDIPDDKMPKTTLIYGNGPGFGRENLTNVDTTGRIDHAHHDNLAKKALHDLAALDEAVTKAASITDEADTLIVVSADHSHVFSMGGYAAKGKDILGLADYLGTWDMPDDKMPKTTLIYGNGPGFGRENLTNVDTTNKTYVFPSAIKSQDETHAGEDVAIYAHGPMAHLFHGVHEQNYIAHVMAYASCVGSNKKHCDDVKPTNTSPQHIVNCSGMIMCLFIAFLSKLT